MQVDSYMTIVRKKLKDMIPKICMHMMVNKSVEFGKEDLLGTIYRDCPDADSLLEESENTKKQREELEAASAAKAAHMAGHHLASSDRTYRGAARRA